MDGGKWWDHTVRKAGHSMAKGIKNEAANALLFLLVK